MSRKFLNKDWERVAQRRRLMLLTLMIVPSFVASGFMARTLPHKGGTALELVLVVFFGILFAWISVGFWTSVAGFFAIIRRDDRFTMAGTDETPIPERTRTAILMPICNENVERIFAGLYAIYRSVENTGKLDIFDFFILSDTSDPDKWVEEEIAWNDLCESVNGHDRLFYRNRRVNIKRKSGNIADFCRRWGANYTYMIIFDADSIMTGPLLNQMIAIMEQNPTVGILQTSPRAVNAKTLFARLHQFSSHLYGPIFIAGLHFWQLGDAQYWGHNAIIRVKPFMKHCALPTLPGSPPFGGYFLSHDFVEAAIMRRAGWGVWLAHDLSGSYEELPPSLQVDLIRDRRWCQGSLQHLRLLFTRGLYPVHRIHFFMGAMAYGSGLLWFLFLAASTIEAFSERLVAHGHFSAKYSHFPIWPVWNQGLAIALVLATALLLFSPKLLSVIIITIKQRRASQFGGIPKLFWSVMAEIVLSTLLAPVRMLFHSKFILHTILGRQVHWNVQQREDRPISWLEALRFHGTGMAFGFVWGGAVLVVNPSFFWWLTPIIAALLVSIPVSVWSSRATVGDTFRKAGIFITPEETATQYEFVWLESYQKVFRSQQPPLAIDNKRGFAMAVVDPCVNSLHLSLLRNERRYSKDILGKRKKLCEKALRLGPARLTALEKKELLTDPASMKALHLTIWKSWDESKAAMWGLPSSSGVARHGS